MADTPSLLDLIGQTVGRVEQWQRTYRPFDAAPSTLVDPERMQAALGLFGDRLTQNYPFFHPDYAGQMLKPPHPAAIAGYVAAMCINPNNHALEGGPPTSAMEKEVVGRIASMFGMETHLGHLTTGGTVANLEALWIARQASPGVMLASADAHYTHARMSGVLQTEFEPVVSDPDGRMNLDALEARLKAGGVGTVVATLGTTGLGAVDRLDEIVRLARQYGARVHVDAAYGGFFALLRDVEGALAPEVAAAYGAIAQADSIVVDPHKHGLQPYGCGCVLFADPAVGRFYRHDSPYTYFTSDELHLGEISLECSRAGAAAAALWLTTEVLPLEPESGFGPILLACRQATQRFADALLASTQLKLIHRPMLDIVCYHADRPTASAVDASSPAVQRAAQQLDDPIHLSLLRRPSAQLDVEADVDQATILRSVLMKPEHESLAESLVDRISAAAAALR
jgi:glutamate/tyrosine decarboxylase-like PLP-dependent enzyme